MTFYEAALRVLEREGKPLHVNAIVEIALKENFLSHVGKSPEEVMQDRLLAMARRKVGRRVVATASATYGLVDWGLPEDPSALEPAGADPRADELPLRPRERHPVPSPDKVRSSGRGERIRKGRSSEEREDRRTRKKFPPLTEVALEVLSRSGGPMSGVDLAAAARERELVSDELGAETLLNALREDNRRRADSGRRPVFVFLPGGEVQLEKAAVGEGTADLEAAFAYALGVPLLPEPRREERGPGASRLIAQAMEHRRQILRLARRRLSDLEAGAFEKAVATLLEQNGYRDLRVVRRSRDATVLTTRRREGLTDLRCAVRLIPGGRELDRSQLEEARRDASQHAAQMSILVCAGDVTREARQEAQQPGACIVVLLCGEALAERCLEKRIGASSTSVEVYDLDEDFFRRCRDRGREEERDRDRRREREPAVPVAERVAAPAAPAAGPGEQKKAERETDAAALAERMVKVAPPPPELDAAALARRREEERVRAAAHERIESAELQARAALPQSNQPT